PSSVLRPPSSALRPSSCWPPLFTAAILLLFVGLAFVHAHKVARNRSAFTRWRPQVLDMDRVDIAKEYNYPNPPIMAVLLEPLARLEPMHGALVWFGFKVVMALLCLVWLCRLVRTDGVPMPPRAVALAVLLALKPIVDDLNHGNVNLFIAFLVVAALTAYRRRRDLL